MMDFAEVSTLEDQAQAAYDAQMSLAIEANEVELFDAVVNGDKLTVSNCQFKPENYIRDFIEEDQWDVVIRLVCLVGSGGITKDEFIERMNNLVNSAITATAIHMAQIDLGFGP